MNGDQGKIRVMIVDDIAETREQLRKLLSFDPDIEVIAMAASGEDAVQSAGTTSPDVVLMDINLPGMDGITATSKLLEVAPAAQVVMLSVQGESDYMRRAMMAGARDYLTKPPSADELLDAIHRMAKLKPRMSDAFTTMVGMMSPLGGDTTTAARKGKIVTIYSPKGGTGCTTLAVNTSIALQNLAGKDSKVGLVDGSLQFGDVAIFMKLQPTRTLADLSSRAYELDTELFNTVLVPHTSGLKVLAAPPTPEDAEPLRVDDSDENGESRRLRAILGFARQEFDYLVIDSSHAVDNVILALLDMSDLFLVVTRPVIPEIRGARMFVELLQRMEYAVSKIGLVINGVDNKRMGIQPEAIERAMMPALAQIPMDERSALRAANYGIPFVVQDPRLPISLAIANLAQLIIDRFAVEELPQPSEQQKKRVGLGRLL